MNISSASVKLGIASIVVGLAGAYLLQVYLAKEQPAPEPPPQPVTVPLATIDLPAGRQVRLGDVGLVKMTTEEMEERGWDLNVLMLSPQQIIGRVLNASLQRGEPFLTSEFYPEGTGPNPLERLKPGFRAVNLQVPLHRGGDVQVGDFVDVLFRSTPMPATETQPEIPEVTVQLASGMEVIDIHVPELTDLQNVTGYEAKPPTVTLAATPLQAQKLLAVGNRGEISLIARAPNETSLVGIGNNELVTFNDILGIQPARAETQQFNTVIYRAGEPQVNTFAMPTLPAKLALPPNEAQPIPSSSGGDRPAETPTDAEAPDPLPAPPILPPLPSSSREN